MMSWEISDVKEQWESSNWNKKSYFPLIFIFKIYEGV